MDHSSHFAAPGFPILSSTFADTLPELAIDAHPEDMPSPQLLLLNEPLADELGLSAEWLRSDEGIQFLLGHALAPGSKPVAQAYSGHQFGQYSPILGDGRAILLGELHTPEGKLVDLHLKGTGRTMFSRGGDGRAALGPMLREFLISESMRGLGIPSASTLAVLTTGRKVQRTRVEPSAVIVRVADSHLRVGTFELVARADSSDMMHRLVQFAIDRHYPDASDAEGLFRGVMERQCETVAKWMGAAFIHGVMNTDNTSISGQTFDFGPCAFMDRYNPDTVFSSIDVQGRYAYGHQPHILGWNLARLVETLVPTIGIDAAQAAMSDFADTYRAAWQRELSQKVGVDLPAELVDALPNFLTEQSLDHTLFFRSLADSSLADGTATGDWVDAWRELDPDLDQVKAVNPIYIPRNHLVEKALADAVEGDMDRYMTLLDLVRKPFDKQDVSTEYEQPAPEGFERFFKTYCGT